MLASSSAQDGPPHILFVLDQLPAYKGGIYAIVRWMITTLHNATFGGHKAAINISCTSYYTADDKESKDNGDFIFKNNVTMVYPKLSTKYKRTDDREKEFNDKPIQFFRHQKDLFKTVTHVVLVSPKTDTSGLPEYIHDLRGDLKVSFLVHMTTISTRDVKIFERYNFGTTFLCVGTQVRIDYVMKTRKIPFRKVMEIFPTGLDLKPGRGSTGFSVLTLYNEYNIYPIPHGKHITKERCFLDTAAKTMGKLANSMNEKYGFNQCEWCVHWPGLSDDTKWKERLEELADTRNLNITFNTDEDVSTLTGMYTLCLQTGYFDLEGYSGLETMLCGIPTLILKDSDVARIVSNTIDTTSFPSFELKNYDRGDPSDAWLNRLRPYFFEAQTMNNFRRMSEILIEYLTSDVVRESKKNMIDELTGTQTKTVTEQRVVRSRTTPQRHPSNQQETTSRHLRHQCHSNASQPSNNDETEVKTPMSPSSDMDVFGDAEAIQTDRVSTAHLTQYVVAHPSSIEPDNSDLNLVLEQLQNDTMLQSKEDRMTKEYWKTNSADDNKLNLKPSLNNEAMCSDSNFGAKQKDQNRSILPNNTFPKQPSKSSSDSDLDSDWQPMGIVDHDGETEAAFDLSNIAHLTEATDLRPSVQIFDIPDENITTIP